MDTLIKNHSNIIWLCSHQEWLQFLKEKEDDTCKADHNYHVAHSKWVSSDKTKRIRHTWYNKCYNTKIFGTRPTLLIIGKGHEFDWFNIDRLRMALHPIKGEVIYEY